MFPIVYLDPIVPDTCLPPPKNALSYKRSGSVEIGVLHCVEPTPLSPKSKIFPNKCNFLGKIRNFQGKNWISTPLKLTINFSPL